jgi:hypothetical protein
MTTREHFIAAGVPTKDHKDLAQIYEYRRLRGADLPTLELHTDIPTRRIATLVRKYGQVIRAELVPCEGHYNSYNSAQVCFYSLRSWSRLQVQEIGS